MTRHSAAGISAGGAPLRHLAAILMTRELFESLPTVCCGNNEAPPASMHKTLIDGQWYAINQEGSLNPIEIRTFILEG